MEREIKDVRVELRAWAYNQPEVVKFIAGTVAENLLGLIRDPHKPGLRALTLANVNKLKAALAGDVLKT